MKRIITLVVLSLWMYVPAVAQVTAEKFADIALVESHNSRRSAGTVYAVLQKHRMWQSPLVLSRENEATAKIQEQVGKIILRLHADHGVEQVVLEGEWHRRVTPNTSFDLARALDALRRVEFCQAILARQLELISADSLLSQETKTQLAEITQRRVSERLGRSLDLVYLIGGTHYAYAKSGGKITVSGGENLDLSTKTEELANKYLLVEAQLQKALGSPLRPVTSVSVWAPDFFSDMESLRNAMAPAGQSSPLWNNTLVLANCLMDLLREDPPDIVIPIGTNPFGKIIDLQLLRRLRNAAWNEFEESALNERNKKAAELTVQVLKESKASAGAVVFGSDHKNGLVREFNRRGYSVIVLTPKLLAEAK